MTPSHLQLKASFIVIGPGKAGTSWVYELLSAHPDVCVSSAKETLFFEDCFQRGTSWYHSFFKHWQGESQIGEVSNTYIFSPSAAKRIKDYNPDIKLISTLRNPVDRAFSHYLFLLRNGEKLGDFQEAIQKQPHLLERGLYFKHLSRYLDFFSRDSLLFLLLDDLKANPESYAQQLLGFLNIETAVASNVLEQKVLPASRARSRRLARSVKQAALTIRDLGFPELVTRVKSSPITQLLYQPYSSESRPRMHKEMRDKLVNYYLDDTRQLSSLLGRDLIASWYA